MNKNAKGAAWFDTECRGARRKSKEKRRTFRKTRIQERLCKIRTKTTDLTRIKKKEFKRNKVALLATNLKNASVFWKELKSLRGKKKKVMQVIKLI